MKNRLIEINLCNLDESRENTLFIKEQKELIGNDNFEDKTKETLIENLKDDNHSLTIFLYFTSIALPNRKLLSLYEIKNESAKNIFIMIFYFIYYILTKIMLIGNLYLLFSVFINTVYLMILSNEAADGYCDHEGVCHTISYYLMNCIIFFGSLFSQVFILSTIYMLSNRLEKTCKEIDLNFFKSSRILWHAITYIIISSLMAFPLLIMTYSNDLHSITNTLSVFLSLIIQSVIIVFVIVDLSISNVVINDLIIASRNCEINMKDISIVRKEIESRIKSLNFINTFICFVLVFDLRKYIYHVYI